jgi:DNA-binding transcriptional LysR family regulator
MITQPSLSHAISSLEKELGVNLFEKDGRNIVLTKCGKIFLDDVEKSLEILDTGIKNLKMTSTGEGRIDIAFLRTLGTDYIPNIIHNFLHMQKGKAIEFHFHTGVSSDIIQGLKEKKYDIAVCSKLENEPSVEFTPIAKEDLVLIVPTNHPLAEKDTIDLIETIPYPQIIFAKKSGLRIIIDELFKQIGKQPKIAYEVEEDQVIAGLVSKNFGIAICPNMPILNSLNVKILQITSPRWERNFYLAKMKNRYLPPIVEELKNYIINEPQK